MNVTKDRYKVRQLNKGYPKKVSAEQKGYVVATDYQRIAENNNTITNFQQESLLEKILDRDNLNKAYKKVKSNKGAGGIDKMNVDELLTYLRDNKEQLFHRLRVGKYKPLPVRRGEISFEKTEVGVPQGGPLSPLLSNIMLNELDKELERRRHRFVRYADDCMIFCKSRKVQKEHSGT